MPQFLLWTELGGSSRGWQPQLWMSPFGALGTEVKYLTLDIALPDRRVDVEVDGPEHRCEPKITRDVARDQWLASQGWRVLRVRNEDVLADPSKVAADVWRWINEDGGDVRR